MTEATLPSGAGENNETCHVSIYVNMLHVKACYEALLALSSLIATWLEKKKRFTTVKSNKIKRAMLIQSNNPLEFTQVEASNHYPFSELRTE